MYFTRADRTEARKLHMPYRRLLTEAPLWISSAWAHAPHRVGFAHADPACRKLMPADKWTTVQLDPMMRFFNQCDGKVSLCATCAARHPLRMAASLVAAALQHKEFAAAGRPSGVALAELRLMEALGSANIARADGAALGLGFWVDWVDTLAAGMVTDLDSARARFALEWDAKPPTAGVYVLVRGPSVNFWAMTQAMRELCAAHPVVARFPHASFVVVAGPELTATWGDALVNERPGGMYVLGPTRPMTVRSWQLFQALAARSAVADAYEASADYVTVLDVDGRRIADELLHAGMMPAETLIRTAAELAR